MIDLILIINCVNCRVEACGVERLFTTVTARSRDGG